MAHRLEIALLCQLALLFTTWASGGQAGQAGVDVDVGQLVGQQLRDALLPVLGSIPAMLSSTLEGALKEDGPEQHVNTRTRKYRSAFMDPESEILQITYPEISLDSHGLFPRGSRPSVVLPGAIIVDPRHGILLPEGRSKKEMEPVIWDSFRVMERYLHRNDSKLPIIKSRKRRSPEHFPPLSNGREERSHETSVAPKEHRSSPGTQNGSAQYRRENEVGATNSTEQPEETGRNRALPEAFALTLQNVSSTDPLGLAAGLRRATNDTVPYLVEVITSNGSYPDQNATLKRVKRFWLVPLQGHRHRREALPIYGRASFVTGHDSGPTDNKTLLTMFAKASEAVLQEFQSRDGKLHDFRDAADVANRYPGDLFNIVVDKTGKEGEALKGQGSGNSTLADTFHEMYQNVKTDDEKRFGRMDLGQLKEDKPPPNKEEDSERTTHQHADKERPHTKHKVSLKRRRRRSGRRPPQSSTDDESQYEDDSDSDTTEDDTDEDTDDTDTDDSDDSDASTNRVGQSSNRVGQSSNRVGQGSNRVGQGSKRVGQSSRRNFRGQQGILEDVFGKTDKMTDLNFAYDQPINSRNERRQRGLNQGMDFLNIPDLRSGTEKDGQLVSVNGAPYVLMRDPEAVKNEGGIQLNREDEYRSDIGDAPASNPLAHQGMIYRALNGRKVDPKFLNSLKTVAIITPDPARVKKDTLDGYPLAVLFRVPKRRLVRSTAQKELQESPNPVPSVKRSARWYSRRKDDSGLVKSKDENCVQVKNSLVCYHHRRV